MLHNDQDYEGDRGDLMMRNVRFGFRWILYIYNNLL